MHNDGKVIDAKERMHAHVFSVPRRDRSNLKALGSGQIGDFFAVVEHYEALYCDGMGVDHSLMGYVLNERSGIRFETYRNLDPRWKPVAAQLALDHVFLEDWVDLVTKGCNVVANHYLYDVAVCTFRDARFIFDGWAARSGPANVPRTNRNGLIRPCIVEVEGDHSNAELIAIAQQHLPLAQFALSCCFDTAAFDIDVSVWHDSSMGDFFGYKQ